MTVKVAYYAEARVVGIVPPTVFAPAAERRERARASSCGVRRRSRCDDPARLFELVRAGFATRRKTLRNALSERARRPRRRRARDAAGIDPCAARRDARPRRLGGARHRGRERSVIIAHACTPRSRCRFACSARAPTATTTSRRSPSRRPSRTTSSSSATAPTTTLTVSGPFAAGVPTRRREPRRARACDRWTATMAVDARTRGFPPAPGSAAARPTRRRCSRASAASRSRRPRSAPTCRSACTAVRRGCAGRGEIVEPIAGSRPLDLVIVAPDFGCSTPAVYRAWDDARRSARRPGDRRARGLSRPVRQRSRTRGRTRRAAPARVPRAARGRPRSDRRCCAAAVRRTRRGSRIDASAATRRGGPQSPSSAATRHTCAARGTTPA